MCSPFWKEASKFKSNPSAHSQMFFTLVYFKSLLEMTSSYMVIVGDQVCMLFKS